MILRSFQVNQMLKNRGFMPATFWADHWDRHQIYLNDLVEWMRFHGATWNECKLRPDEL